VANPLFGTAINGLQGRVLEFASPHELLRCYLYWGGDVTTSPPEVFKARWAVETIRILYLISSRLIPR
jgi:hypothetical protein